mgnify:CR=1 FL=1
MVSEFVGYGADPADHWAGAGDHDQVVVFGLAEKMVDGSIDIDHCVSDATSFAHRCGELLGIDASGRRRCARNDELVLVDSKGAADVDRNPSVLHAKEQKAATTLREVVGEGTSQCGSAGNVVGGVEQDRR